MQVSTAEFRKGLKIELDGQPYNIVEFQHVKPGKGGAFVRTKLKHLRLGRVVELVDDVRLGAAEAAREGEEALGRQRLLARDDRHEMVVERGLDGAEGGGVHLAGQVDAPDLAAQGVG